MKIVHAHWSLNTGGTETMMVDIMNEQVKEHEVWCLILNDVVDERVKAKIDSKIHFKCYFRKNKIKGLFDVVRFNLDLINIQPDVIHCHGESFPFIIKYRKAPIVLTRHSTLGDGRFLHYADQLCFISEAVRQHSLAQGFDGKVIYNGIHVEHIIKKSCSFNHYNNFKIVQVGRLEEIKGQQILVEAALLLNKAGLHNFNIDFIGDGSMRQALENKIKDYNLEDCIRLLGSKDRTYIYQHLCDYDLFVQASLSEGFGLTIAEGIAAGIPVLSCDLDGPMEVIGNGKYGTYFRTGDSVDLAKKLQRFLDGKEPDKTKAAYDFLTCNFTIQSTAQNYLKLYSNLINKKRNDI